MSAPLKVTGLSELPRIAQVCWFLLAGALGAMTIRLWPEWRGNPDLSHGFFMPLVFGLLLHEARQQPARFVRPTALTASAFTLLLLGGSAALVAAGLYAAAVDWSHPLVNNALTASFVCALAAGYLAFAHAGVRWINVRWSGFVAILLWLLCTPIPPGTYSRLTLTLQLWVSEGVLRTLHVLGIAAIRHGNIIQLANTTVGVEEACSGVRSLISCIFAGLFFSATLVRSRWARCLIIGLSAPLALLMNFIRSLALTLLSNNGVDISGAWHDVTGFAVLGVTAGLLAALALLLGRTRGAADNRETPAIAEAPVPRLQFGALIAALVVTAVLVLVSVAHTQPSPRRDTPVPDLHALLPTSFPGWSVSTSDNLFQFEDTLQTKHLAQRTYRKPGPDGKVTEVIVYLAYWRAGQATVSLVASHTPDACWPGSGWTALKVDRPRAELTVSGRRLPAAEYRHFTLNDFPQHVWFWHVYDGQPITYRDPYSAIELLRIAWNFGFRREGDQLFVRVSSNRPWATLADEPLLAEFFNRARQVGL